MLRDEILRAKDITVHPLECPEWGCTVFVKTFDGHDRAKLVKLIKDAPADADAKAFVFVATDQGGNRVFSETDVPAILGKSAAVVSRVVKAAMLHNGSSNEAHDEAKNG